MPHVVLRHRDIPGIDRLDTYRANGGFEALQKAVTSMKPGEVTEIGKNSGLRGRGGAGFPTGTKWSLPTRMPTITPTPAAIEVGFDTLFQRKKGDFVTMKGILELPTSTHCSTTWCGIFLEDPTDRSRRVTIFINIPYKEDTPEPNEMMALPEKYTPADFKVRTGDGEIIGDEALVQVTGYICETTDGDLCLSDFVNIQVIAR